MKNSNEAKNNASDTLTISFILSLVSEKPTKILMIVIKPVTIAIIAAKRCIYVSHLIVNYSKKNVIPLATIPANHPGQPIFFKPFIMPSCAVPSKSTTILSVSIST